MEKANYKRIAIQLLLAPSYVVAILFVLDRLGALRAISGLGYVFEGIFYVAGMVVLSLWMWAIFRMKRSLARRIAYAIIAIVLFVPYMLLPIMIYLVLALFLGTKF